jgi:hypothetical protein
MLEILSLISVSLLLFILGTLWALWILYVAMMNIKGSCAQGELPWQAKLMVIPTTLVFDLVEFVANVFVCTIIFLDWPREFTVSDRLRRYANNAQINGWQSWVLNFIRPMLDPFDPEGPHI